MDIFEEDTSKIVEKYALKMYGVINQAQYEQFDSRNKIDDSELSILIPEHRLVFKKLH